MMKKYWIFLIGLLFINTIIVYVIANLLFGSTVSICFTILSVIVSYCIICYNKNKKHIRN